MKSPTNCFTWLIVPFFVSSLGCGTDKAPPAAPKSPVTRTTFGAETIEAGSQSIGARRSSPGPPGVGPGGLPMHGLPQESAAKPPEEKKPTRPDEVADWDFDDFASARIDGDFKLLEAVQHLIAERVDEADVIEMLVGLLQIDPPKEPEPDNAEGGPRGIQPGFRGPNPGFRNPYGFQPGQPTPSEERRWVFGDVAEAIVEGLGNSNLPEAFTVLKNLLNGKQQIPLRQDGCVTSVTRALLTNINSEKESVLFSMLTKPDEVKPYEFTEPVERSPTQSDSSRTGLSGYGGAVGMPGHGGPWGPGGGSRNTRQRRNPMVQGAGLDEGWIQEEVLFQAGGKVSKKFRIALAKFVDNPDVVIETAKLVEKYLIVDDPRNDAAQVLLIKNAATETDTRGLLEAVLIERSSEVLCELLGIPQSNISANRSGVGRPGFGLPGIGGRNLGPGGFSQRPQPFQRSAGNRFGADRSNRTGRKSRLDQSTDTEETVVEHDPDKRMRQQVVLLWRPQVAKMLRKSMMSNDFKGVNTQIPLLLGTIPLKSSRSALSEILQTSSDKGPTEWFSMGLFGSTTIDPALLVYGKRQYHQSGGRGPTGGKEGRVGGSVATWPDQIERYVADLCERFHGAQHISNTEEEPISVSKLPVRIHRRANIVARYDLHWPEGVGKKWKRFDIAPLELHYLRFEEEDVANKIIFHYRHHNKDAREVGLSNGVWFDRFDESEQLSVDIRITVPDGGGLGVPVGRELNNRNGRSQAGAGKTKFERKRLVIEVLTVNISTSEAEEGS